MSFKCQNFSDCKGGYVINEVTPLGGLAQPSQSNLLIFLQWDVWLVTAGQTMMTNRLMLGQIRFAIKWGQVRFRGQMKLGQVLLYWIMNYEKIMKKRWFWINELCINHDYVRDGARNRERWRGTYISYSTCFCAFEYFHNNVFISITCIIKTHMWNLKRGKMLQRIHKSPEVWKATANLGTSPEAPGAFNKYFPK